jgi:methyl-accepting chemotaxis protein
MLKNTRIATKLMLVGMLIMIASLGAVTYLAVQRSTRAVRAIEDEQLGRAARLIAARINDVFREEARFAIGLAMEQVFVDAATAANAPPTPAVVPARGSTRAALAVDAAAAAVQKATDRMREIKADVWLGQSYESVMCVGKDGTAFATTEPRSVGKSFSDRPYIQKALSGVSTMGTVVASWATSRPVAPIAVPIKAGDDVVGAFVLVLDATFLSDLVTGEKIGLTGYAYVVDQTGLIIAHPVVENVLKTNLAELDGTRDFAGKMIAGQAGVSTYVFQGVAKTAGFAPVPSLGWSVGVTLPDVEYLASANDLRNIIIAIAGAAVLASLLIYFFFARSITRPLGRGVAFAEQVAGGDFTRELALDRGDEVGKLAAALNSMSVKLRAMVEKIQDSAVQVASSSEQITASAQRLSEGAQTQASTLEETSASMEQLSASVDQVAEHAQSQAAAVEQGSSSMAQVRRSIEEVSKDLAEIAGLATRSVENALEGARAVSAVVEGINLIAGSSEKIGGIVTVISDIADQTNLLALNASIEAARAGEHGRGFAVVADEVSKLADRSSASTKEIVGLIKESVKNVDKGVETAHVSQLSMEQIRAASQQVKDTISGLSESMTQQVEAVKELSRALESVSEMSQSISAATEEQTTNAKQVSKAVENINEVTQAAASATEEMTAATEQLASMAQELQKLTAQFKLSGNGSGGNGNGLLEAPVLDLTHIDRAMAAHGNWKTRLRDAIHSGKSDANVATVAVDNACEFGKWFLSLPNAERGSAQGRVVQTLHAQFHRAAANVLEMALAGRREEAELAMGTTKEFAQVSAKLTVAMIEWKNTLARRQSGAPELHVVPPAAPAASRAP